MGRGPSARGDAAGGGAAGGGAAGGGARAGGAGRAPGGGARGVTRIVPPPPAPGSPVWTVQSDFVSDIAVAGDRYGFSVALSSDGNTLALGSPGENFNTGAVRVFRKSSGQWTIVTMLDGTGNGFDEGDQFGHAVAISGDGRTVAVGAPYSAGFSTPRVKEQGEVLVWSDKAGTEKIMNYLPKNLKGGAEGDRFGWSVSLDKDGEVMAVGAP